MPRLETLHADATLRLASHRNLLLAVWCDAPTLEQMRELGRASRAISRRHPAGADMLNVVLSGKPTFSDAVRQEGIKLTSDPTLIRLGTAHLVLVTGLAGAATKAFLSTMLLVGRPAVPTKVFADPDGAAAWLAPRLSLPGAEWSAAEVKACQAEAGAAAANVG